MLEGRGLGATRNIKRNVTQELVLCVNELKGPRSDFVSKKDMIDSAID